MHICDVGLAGFAENQARPSLGAGKECMLKHKNAGSWKMWPNCRRLSESPPSDWFLLTIKSICHEVEAVCAVSDNYGCFRKMHIPSCIRRDFTEHPETSRLGSRELIFIVTQKSGFSKKLPASTSVVRLFAE